MQCTVKTPQTLISNEIYIKKCIVVAGVLYWLYGMMPIVDELFNVITLVALAYIFLFFCKRKQNLQQKLLGIVLVFSAILTILANEFKTINIIAVLYALVEIMLLTYCDFRKSKKELQDELDDIVNTFIVGGFVIIILSMLVYLMGYKIMYCYPEITTTRFFLGRDESTGALIGIMSNANIASNFCVIYLGFLLYSLNRKKCVLKYVAMICDVVMLVLTFSRGGYVGAFILVVFYVGLKLLKDAHRSRNASLELLIVMMVSLFAITIIIASGGVDFSKFTGRTQGEMAGSTQQRILLLKAAVTAVTSNFQILLFGTGSEIRQGIAMYASKELSEKLYNNMHNIYAQILMSYGIIGLIPFLATIFKYLKGSLRQILFCSRTTNKELIALVALVIALLVINLVESDIYMKKAFEGTVFWLLLGYIYAILSKCERRSEK